MFLLVLAHLGSPGQRAVKTVAVYYKTSTKCNSITRTKTAEADQGFGKVDLSQSLGDRRTSSMVLLKGPVRELGTESPRSWLYSANYTTMTERKKKYFVHLAL